MELHFITGMLRSGTTLLNQIVDKCDDHISFYQPMTDLFIEAKKQFFKKIGFEEDHFFLYHMSSPDCYSDGDVTDFLLNNKILYADSKDHFALHYRNMLKKTGCSQFQNAGCKEVLSEEFIPYFLKQNIKVMQIIRDPRAVLFSMNYGSSDKYVGGLRPTLFNLRNWRKSADYYLKYQNAKNFFAVKYEDLVTNEDIITKLCRFLGTENNIRVSEISTNSSFGSNSGIAKDSVDKWINSLPESVIEYTDSILQNYLKKLGYTVKIRSRRDRIKIINDFKDPYIITRKEFPKNYSSQKDNIDYETVKIKSE
ncbi:MAG: sulfotransferase domain-containing protein [Candidatus Delongbacteria bacterium]